MRRLSGLWLVLFAVGCAAETGESDSSTQPSDLLSASNVYLSARGGGNGSSCTSPQSPAWFNNPSNWGAAAGKIGPGTTVHLCGTFSGSAGEQLLAAQGSGTSSAPVTIRFEPNAVLTAPYWSSGGAISSVGHNGYHSFVTVDGGTNGLIENTQNGTGRAFHNASKAVVITNCNGCTVKNLTIENIYVRTADSDLTVDQTQNNCVAGNNAPSTTISHITCRDAGWALTVGGSNYLLENSDLSRVDHGIAMGAAGVTSNITIRGNHFHDYVNWDSWDSGQSNTDAYHHDGIHLWGENGGIIEGGNIYDNVFDGDSGVNITGHVYLQHAIHNVNVFNNVFMTPTTRTIVSLWFAAASGDGATGNAAYNNFIDAGALRNAHGYAGCGLFIASQASFTAENNIVIGGSADASFQGGSTLSATGLHSNLYEDLFTDYGDTNMFGFEGLTYHTLASWQAAVRSDAGSLARTMVQLGIGSGGVPNSGSPAIGMGKNLTNLCVGGLAPLCRTKSGSARPTSGAWNAGAY